MSDDAGELAHYAPRARPGEVSLVGRYGRIEKLDAKRDASTLWTAFGDVDSLWDYMSYGPFADFTLFETWLQAHATSEDPFVYTVLDRHGQAKGLAALMRITPDMGVIEVGHILYSPALQRTPLGTEAQYLLAAYVFDTLRYRRYEWKCNALNVASRRAAARYGFTFEGVFRQHMVVKGENRDTAWFSITDREWPERKAAFERWLDAGNFDAQGRQKTRLGSSVAASSLREMT